MKILNPVPEKSIFPPALYQELDVYIDTLGIQEDTPRRKEFLIQVLHKAQHVFGYLPEEIQIHVANRFFIHHADVSGVVSFYN
jgi:NADH:ubiquinone oxidoreductase subunit E